MSFDANSLDPEDDTLTHEWDWDYDGNTFTVDQNTGTAATANHQYAGAGTFTAVVRVSDGQGNTVTETVSVSVTSLTSLPVESHFDSNADGWVYVDDAFRATSTPNFADGSYDPAGGLSGGGLTVELGGGSGAGVALSGGWQTDLNLAAATDVVISFGYNLTQGSDYEGNEFSQVLLSVDGTLHGAGANDYVDQIVGDGDGGVAVSTGWQGFQVTVNLAAGSHTVVIGGWNTQSTSASEVTTIQIDDVSIQDAATAGPVISQHPSDKSVVEGSLVTFAVQATGTGTLSYQWYEQGAAVGVTLPAGEQVIRLAAVTAQVNVNWIEIAAASGADELPVVAFTSPTDGDTITSTAAVVATAYDPDVGTSNGDGIASVLLELIGGSGVAGSHTENQAPYEWSLDPATYPNGQYTLRATATSTGAAGGRYDSASITLTLENPLVDTDGDGIWDNDEVFYGLDPNDSDEDRNDVLDGDDDWNSNGIDNKTDIANGTDPGSPPAPPPSDDGGCVALRAGSHGTGCLFTALMLVLPLLEELRISRRRPAGAAGYKAAGRRGGADLAGRMTSVVRRSGPAGFHRPGLCVR